MLYTIVVYYRLRFVIFSLLHVDLRQKCIAGIVCFNNYL